MVFKRSPVKRTRNGNYQISLSDHERDVLRELPSELIKLLESGDDDGSMFRLFPPGYTNDLGRQLDYDRLMRDELQSRHVEALRHLEATVDAKELTEDDLDGWLKALNQIRLVLGTRLNVTDEMTEDDISPDDPRASAFALYGYLGYLQDQAVDAMSDEL